MAVVKYKSKDGSYKTLYNYNVNNVPIVQGTGSATDSVMSQKAVTDELAKYVEKPATGTEYATQKWVTDQEYLQEGALSNYATKSEVNAKADSATTLAGYGITDAKITDGTITLGNETLTPLSTDALTGYATQQWIQEEGYTKTEGTVKSVGGASAPDSHLTLTGTVTETGNLTVGVEDGYSIPSTTKQTEWDNKQDEITDLDTIKSNATNGQTAYGWGNHAEGGYLQGTIEVVNVSSNQTNYTKTVAVGQQAHVIFANSGSSTDYTVAISTTYKTPDGQALTLNVPKGGYAEANFMNIGGTIYARGL